jgi:hypothetical protein
MQKISCFSAVLIASLIMISCNSTETVELFNGENLENWDTYVSVDSIKASDLFWVEDGMIHTAGVPHGYIRTKESYRNFKLHVEWRWVDEPTNSGVLLHVTGKDMIWPLCIEAQLKNDRAGDIVLIGKGSGITAGDSTYLITSEENRYAVAAKLEDVGEKPAGEWNSYEIISMDGELELRVNGVLQNKGMDMTLTEGNIALQSEGSAMQFRNIILEKL